MDTSIRLSIYLCKYRERSQSSNDNLMVIAMVETLIGVDASAEIAGVDGVDAVFVASGDLGSFSGRRQGEPGQVQ